MFKEHMNISLYEIVPKNILLLERNNIPLEEQVKTYLLFLNKLTNNDDIKEINRIYHKNPDL